MSTYDHDLRTFDADVRLCDAKVSGGLDMLEKLRDDVTLWDKLGFISERAAVEFYRGSVEFWQREGRDVRAERADYISRITVDR